MKSSGHTRQKSPTADSSRPPATPARLFHPFQPSTIAANRSTGAALNPAMMMEGGEESWAHRKR